MDNDTAEYTISIGQYSSTAKPAVKGKSAYLTHCSLGYKMAAMMITSASPLKVDFWQCFFQKSAVLVANRLEPRSGPTHVGSGLGFSLFATV